MYRMLVAGDDPPYHVQLDSLNGSGLGMPQ